MAADLGEKALFLFPSTALTTAARYPAIDRQCKGEPYGKMSYHIGA